MTADEIRRRIYAGIGRARTHGFTQSDELMSYLDFLFEVGPDADLEPRVAAILAESRYAPATRMDLVRRTLADQEPSEEPETPAHELPDATWPEPERCPVPPPPVLVPPDPSCFARPPWEEHG